MALSYKCTSVGCYSYQSPETNTLFQKLQATLNQFAPALAFSPIKVDGIIGKGTTEVALLTLLYLGELDNGVVGSAARALEAGINTPEQLALNAQSVLDTLTLAIKQPPAQIAQQLAPPSPLPPPTPQPSTTQLATTTANKPPSSSNPNVQNSLDSLKKRKPALATSLLDHVPPAAAYIGGAALAIGAIAAVVIAKRRREAKSTAPESAVAGW